MLKEYKYYFININVIDGKRRPFRVRVVINNRSVSNLVHLLLVN